MNKQIFVAAVLCAAFVGATFISCKSTVKTTGTGIDGDWTLRSVTSADSTLSVPSGTTATLSITQLKSKTVTVSGHTGTNSFSGTGNIKGNSISVAPLAVTMMIGTPEEDELERAFLEVLNDADTFKIYDNINLEITSSMGKKAVFVRRSLQGTSWTLRAYNNEDVIMLTAQAEPLPSITFEGSETISGFTGVNNLMGNCKIIEAARTVYFSDLGTTRMAPRDAEADELEQRYLLLLEGAAKYTMSGSTLSLLDANGQTLLLFVEQY